MRGRGWRCAKCSCSSLPELVFFLKGRSSVMMVTGWVVVAVTEYAHAAERFPIKSKLALYDNARISRSLQGQTPPLSATLYGE